MPRPAPFSVTPDAEDYLRSRLSEIQRQAEPVIMMAAKLGDAVDDRGEKIRYWYEGESFDVCYFDPAEQPQAEEIELLGRSVSITTEALKHLAGQTLKLRRVKSGYGLIADQHYVLVADSVSHATDAYLDGGDRIIDNLSIAALTVLGGFSSVGIVWILICVVVPLLKSRLKISDDEFLSSIIPLFIVGWIVGATISFFLFRSIFKAKGRTRYVLERTQEKYLGQVGLNADLSIWIFFGIPLPLTIVLAMVLEHFARTIGQKTIVVFVAIMVVGIPTMYFRDRIPHKIVVRLGLLGWALTILGGYWYFKTYGP